MVQLRRRNPGQRNRPTGRWRAAVQVRDCRRDRQPYAGRYSESLAELVDPSPLLGEEFGRRIQALAGAHEIVSYGKAILVGSAGEYEHGNVPDQPGRRSDSRRAGGGKSWVPSTGKRGGPGSTIDVPLAHKDALYVRSHYDSMSLMFGDGPAPDEVIVIWAFATRGRLHARLGGLLAEDIKGIDGLH